MFYLNFHNRLSINKYELVQFTSHKIKPLKTNDSTPNLYNATEYSIIEIKNSILKRKI